MSLLSNISKSCDIENLRDAPINANVDNCNSAESSSHTICDNNKTRWHSVPSHEAIRKAVAALYRFDDFYQEHIGSGFFSDVYKVTHKLTNEIMVLKVNLSPSNRGNVLKEIELMNKLCHQNILRFKGVCVSEGQLHPLTEFMNGGNLEQLLLNHGIELSWKIRVQLALDIAKGMAYLHCCNIFHRDLTSKNILISINAVTKEHRAVVADFGLATRIPDEKHKLLTVGSAYWISPECLRGEWYNEKSDVFSYGIILCEIIARVEADPDVLPRTENFGLDYLAFSEMCPECPPLFLELALCCCYMNPNDRPTFCQLVLHLQKLLNNILVSEDNFDGDEHSRLSSLEEMNLICHNKSSQLIESSNESINQAISPKHQNLNDCTSVTNKNVGKLVSLSDPFYKPCPKNMNPFLNLKKLWTSDFLHHFKKYPLKHLTINKNFGSHSIGITNIINDDFVVREIKKVDESESNFHDYSCSLNSLDGISSWESGFFSTCEADQSCFNDTIPDIQIHNLKQLEGLTKSGQHLSSLLTDSLEDVSGVSEVSPENLSSEKCDVNICRKDVKQIVCYFEKKAANAKLGKQCTTSLFHKKKISRNENKEWYSEKSPANNICEFVPDSRLNVFSLLQ